MVAVRFYESTSKCLAVSEIDKISQRRGLWSCCAQGYNPGSTSCSPWSVRGNGEREREREREREKGVCDMM